MKLKILVLLSVLGYVCSNIENSFLQNELSDYSSLRKQVEQYLENRETKVDERMKGWSWQENINYIEESVKGGDDNEVVFLRRFVDRFIRTIPIPQWPLVMRFMVFPQIYGYYSNDVLRAYLLKLHHHQAQFHPFLTGDNFSLQAANDMFSAISSEDKDKLHYLEKVSQLEQLKAQVDVNLLLQTQHLLNADDYINRLHQLVLKVDSLAHGLKANATPTLHQQIHSAQAILNSIIPKN